MEGKSEHGFSFGVGDFLSEEAGSGNIWWWGRHGYGAGFGVGNSWTGRIIVG